MLPECGCVVTFSSFSALEESYVSSCSKQSGVIMTSGMFTSRASSTGKKSSSSNSSPLADVGGTPNSSSTGSDRDDSIKPLVVHDLLLTSLLALLPVQVLALAL